MTLPEFLKQPYESAAEEILPKENAEQQRQEVGRKNPQKILCVCMAGVNRSRAIAEELTGRGYKGWNKGAHSGVNPLTQEDIDQADLIIFATINAADIAAYNFIFDGKMIRMLPISESVSPTIRHGGAGKEKVMGDIKKGLDELGLENKAS